MRIGVIGMGGVGGYFGGKLAGRYSGGRESEVFFIARGKHLEAIQKSGLRLMTVEGEYTVSPDGAVEKPEELGRLDLVLFCVKGYDLEAAARSLSSNLDAGSTLLPLMNGVGNGEKLRKLLPGTRVLNGCVYIGTHIAAPGRVRQVGGSCRLLFGPEEGDAEEFRGIETILRQAGILAELTPSIREAVWEKFIFIGPLAGVTSLRRETFGEVAENPTSRELLEKLMREAVAVARGKGIALPDDIVQKSVEKISTFPPGTKSSLQLDFEQGKPTELETFIGYTVKAGESLGLDLPGHREVYRRLLAVTSPSESPRGREPAPQAPPL